MKHLLCRITLLLLALLMTCAQAETDVDLGSHYLASERLRGSCQLLRGNMELTVVMVSTEEAPWYSMDAASLRTVVRAAIDDLEANAESYGVRLNITPRYYQATGSSDPDEENWEHAVLSTVPELAERSTTEWFNQPILFCLNAEGRSFAITTWLRSSLEYVVYYMDYNPGSVRHELLHLFGAEDYYFHPALEAAASLVYPDSIMLVSTEDSPVDSLTAWLVGWTTMPDETALAFLRSTADLSEDDLKDARATDQRTGTGMFEMESGAFYGTLEMGCPNGPGYYLWDDGSSYLGDWVWSSRSGKGVYTWPDGDSYVGDYVNDERTGAGVFTWADGDVYAGSFVHGQMTGTGVFTWADGTTYAGGFDDGQRSGTGVFTWPDGTTYTGEITDGALTGRGMIIYSDGSMYLGEVVDGKPHGVGTKYPADGTAIHGVWSGGVIAGDR